MLASWIFWMAVACCAVAQVAIVHGLVVARSAPVAPGTPRPARAAEVMWVVLPALMLAAALYFTWQKVRADEHVVRAVHAARSTQHAAAAQLLPK